MRIKGSLATGVLVALTLSLIPVAAIPAQTVTSGATCKTYNQKIVFKNKTYACIKSGNRLIWNTGVVIIKPISSPTPTPTPTPTPLASPILNQISDPRETILGRAISKIQNSGNSKNVVITDMKVEGNFNEIAKRAALAAQDKTVSIFGDLFPTGAKFNLILANSYDFVTSSLKELGGSESWVATQTPLLKSAYPSGVATRRPIWAFATYLNGDRTQPTIVYLSFPTYKYELNASEVGAHEMFHLVQNILDSTAGNLPCWLHEGQASIVGTALSTESNQKESLVALIKSDDQAHSAGADLSKIEAPFGWQNNGHGPCGDLGEYQQGRIANAYLIDKFGMAKNLEFLKALDGQPGDGISWKSAFLKVFQIKSEDFYTEANAYIKWFFKQYFNQDI